MIPARSSLLNTVLPCSSISRIKTSGPTRSLSTGFGGGLSGIGITGGSGLAGSSAGTSNGLSEGAIPDLIGAGDWELVCELAIRGNVSKKRTQTTGIPYLYSRQF